jgi:hypothetical protein
MSEFETLSTKDELQAFRLDKSLRLSTQLFDGTLEAFLDLPDWMVLEFLYDCDFATIKTSPVAAWLDDTDEPILDGQARDMVDASLVEPLRILLNDKITPGQLEINRIEGKAPVFTESMKRLYYKFPATVLDSMCAIRYTEPKVRKLMEFYLLRAAYLRFLKSGSASAQQAQSEDVDSSSSEKVSTNADKSGLSLLGNIREPTSERIQKENNLRQKVKEMEIVEKYGLNVEVKKPLPILRKLFRRSKTRRSKELQGNPPRWDDPGEESPRDDTALRES